MNNIGSWTSDSLDCERTGSPTIKLGSSVSWNIVIKLIALLKSDLIKSSTSLRIFNKESFMCRGSITRTVSNNPQWHIPTADACRIFFRLSSDHERKRSWQSFLPFIHSTSHQRIFHIGIFRSPNRNKFPTQNPFVCNLNHTRLNFTPILLLTFHHDRIESLSLHYVSRFQEQPSLA